MNKDIHPKVNPVIFIDSSSGTEFVTTSTLTSDETREIDGVTYYVCRIEISSASHPFYTGKQIFVDSARRVEKFHEKMAKVDTASAARKGKKAKRVARTKTATTATPKKAKKKEVEAQKVEEVQSAQ